MRFSFTHLMALLLGASRAQESCDSACQTAFKGALLRESSGWVSKNVTLDEFYTTPANTTGAKPGALLRWQQVSRNDSNTKFTAPTGMSLARFMYMTEDIERNPIPATGYVLLPYSKPNRDEPLNTIVWTHGTAGRIRNCAPSNNKDLHYEWRGPYALALAGYAVIAPDYSGQGSDIPQGFMYEAGFLHAADAVYGLVAARKVLGDLLSKEYVVVGHSEGGMTAWRTNERLAMPDQEELLKAGKFLGSVAAAPALRPLDLFPESIRRANGGPFGGANAILLLQSLALLFPNTFRLEDYLTDAALDLLPLLDQGCILVANALHGNFTSAQMFKKVTWYEHPDVVDWQKRYNGAGPHALAAPMLVIQGIADSLVYAVNTRSDFNRTCSAFPESRVSLLLHPEVDHLGASMVIVPDYLAWIKDRFDGVEVPEGCHTRTKETITNTFRTVVSYYSGSQFNALSAKFITVFSLDQFIRQ